MTSVSHSSLSKIITNWSQYQPCNKLDHAAANSRENPNLPCILNGPKQSDLTTHK